MQVTQCDGAVAVMCNPLGAPEVACSPLLLLGADHRSPLPPLSSLASPFPELARNASRSVHVFVRWRWSRHGGGAGRQGQWREWAARETRGVIAQCVCGPPLERDVGSHSYSSPHSALWSDCHSVLATTRVCFGALLCFCCLCLARILPSPGCRSDEFPARHFPLAQRPPLRSNRRVRLRARTLSRHSFRGTGSAGPRCSGALRERGTECRNDCCA